MPEGPEAVTRRGFAGLRPEPACWPQVCRPVTWTRAKVFLRRGMRCGLLMQGNRRWARARAVHPHQSVPWRLHVAEHQEPFANVLSCVDSRVPPEIVFDRGIGDMFVVRTGAQTLDDLVVSAVSSSGRSTTARRGSWSCSVTKNAAR